MAWFEQPFGTEIASFHSEEDFFYYVIIQLLLLLTEPPKLPATLNASAVIFPDSVADLDQCSVAEDHRVTEW